jgi:hypothetical protein
MGLFSIGFAQLLRHFSSVLSPPFEKGNCGEVARRVNEDENELVGN